MPSRLVHTSCNAALLSGGLSGMGASKACAVSRGPSLIGVRQSHTWPGGSHDEIALGLHLLSAK
jgi:hypothetical protein